MLKRFQSGSFEGSVSPTETIEKECLLCYTGKFESLDGEVVVTKPMLEAIAQNHNAKMAKAKLQGNGKIADKFCPPVQLDHSKDSTMTVGRVKSELRVAPYKTLDGDSVWGLYGTVIIIGDENVKKASNGLWTNLSIGADFEEGVIQELTITPFPAAAEASMLSKGKNKNNKNLSNKGNVMKFKRLTKATYKGIEFELLVKGKEPNASYYCVCDDLGLKTKFYTSASDATTAMRRMIEESGKDAGTLSKKLAKGDKVKRSASGVSYTITQTDSNGRSWSVDIDGHKETFEDDSLATVITETEKIIKGMKSDGLLSKKLSNGETVKWYVDKFFQKVGSGREPEVIGWVEGIGKAATDEEKKEILKQIKAKGGIKKLANGDMNIDQAFEYKGHKVEIKASQSGYNVYVDNKHQGSFKTNKEALAKAKSVIDSSKLSKKRLEAEDLKDWSTKDLFDALYKAEEEVAKGGSNKSVWEKRVKKYQDELRKRGAKLSKKNNSKRLVEGRTLKKIKVGKYLVHIVMLKDGTFLFEIPEIDYEDGFFKTQDEAEKEGKSYAEQIQKRNLSKKLSGGDMGKKLKRLMEVKSTNKTSEGLVVEIAVKDGEYASEGAAQDIADRVAERNGYGVAGAISQGFKNRVIKFIYKKEKNLSKKLSDGKEKNNLKKLTDEQMADIEKKATEFTKKLMEEALASGEEEGDKLANGDDDNEELSSGEEGDELEGDVHVDINSHDGEEEEMEGVQEESPRVKHMNQLLESGVEESEAHKTLAHMADSEVEQAIADHEARLHPESELSDGENEDETNMSSEEDENTISMSEDNDEDDERSSEEEEENGEETLGGADNKEKPSDEGEEGFISDRMKHFKHLTDVEKMEEGEAFKKIGEMSEEEVKCACETNAKKLENGQTTGEPTADQIKEQDRKINNAKMSKGNAKIKKLALAHKETLKKARLSLVRAKIGARLSSLKALGKITPAEVKKLNVEKLSLEDNITLEKILRTYEDREPVVHTGIVGTQKAIDVHHLSKKIKEMEMEELEDETIKNMPFLKNARMSKTGGNTKTTNLGAIDPASIASVQKNLVDLEQKGKIKEAMSLASKSLEDFKRLSIGEREESKRLGVQVLELEEQILEMEKNYNDLLETVQG